MSFYREKCPLISLPHLKKRLRHITTLGFHDLVVNEIHFTVHFTLHVNQKSIAFYTSEFIENLRCPEWKYLKYPLQYQCLQDFIMRLWITNSSDCYLILEYDIHLDNTIIPDEQKDRITKKENTLWLIMFDYRFTDTDDEKKSIGNSSKERFEFANSYNKSSINRMISTFNKIREDKQNSSVQRELISKCLEENKTYFDKLKECETRRIRIETLKEYIVYRQHSIEQSKQICEERRQLLEDRQNQLNEQLPQLERLQHAISQSLYRFQQSESILRNFVLINRYRRREILSQIYRYFYPIEKDQQNIFSINNIKLPPSNNEIYQSKLSREREYEITAALGFCSHLIVILSDLIHLPLRYPIDIYGQSEIKIYDFNAEPDEYPLQSTTNIHAFRQGFSLLNLNIGQIMYHCRIGERTDSSNNTLENLKKLVEQFLINTRINIPIRSLRADEINLSLKRSSISSSASLLETIDESNSVSKQPQLTMQISHQLQN